MAFSVRNDQRVNSVIATNVITGGLTLATQVQSPSNGGGVLWYKAGSPPTLMFTSEDGVDHAITTTTSLTLNMTFDVLNAGQDPMNTPFGVRLDIQASSSQVIFKLPGINATIPNGGGFLATIDGFLPRPPVDALYQTATLESNQTSDGFDLAISTDGSLRISGKGGAAIAAGPQIIQAKTITYTVPSSQPPAPTNFDIATDFSCMAQPDNPDAPDQFLDWYIPSVQNGRVAWIYPDNSKTKDTPPYNLNVMTRTGTIGSDGSLTLDPPVAALTVPLGVYCGENSIAVDPTNTDNMFFTTIYLDRRSLPRVLRGMVGVSHNSGSSWVTKQLDLPPLPHFRSDQNALYDKFGNLWLIALTSATNNHLPFGLAILLSTDKGESFNVAWQAPTPTLPFGYDYPQLAFGGDGHGGYALWWTVNYLDFATFATYNCRLGYIPISTTGVPNLGGATQIDLPNTSPFTNPLGIITPSLTVNAAGQVFFWGTAAVPPAGGDFFNVSVMYINPVGTGFTAADIVGPLAVTQTNVGAASSSLNVPFQMSRGVRQPSGHTLAYDDQRGILYAIVNDIAPWTSTDMTIKLVASKNLGASWSDRLNISSRQTGGRALPGITLDPSTGNLVAGWLDTADDPSNINVKYTGVIISASDMEAILADLPSSSSVTAPSARPKPTASIDKSAVAEILKKHITRRHSLE